MATSKRNLSSYDKSQVPNGAGLTIGIVVSDWNDHITHSLLAGAKEALLDCGVLEDNIPVYHVPGSFELIYGAKRMAQLQMPDAIIVLGSVIRGETAHFDFVCNGVANGIAQLNIELSIPVIFGLLTDNNEQQAIDRSGGKHGNKGTECAIAALQMTAINS